MRILFRIVCLLFGISLSFYFSGYIAYITYVSNLRPPEILKQNEAIIALTGEGGKRLKTGYGLLKEKKGKKFLISGVNPKSSSKKIQENLQADRDLFKCCVDLGYDARNTWGNGLEVKAWLNQNDYQSVILVTSNYHMPRAHMILKHHTHPDISFRLYPVPVLERYPEIKDWISIRWFREYTKYILFLLYFSLPL